MAKIIYGVAGEGFGHSSRSHIIAKRLIESGHDVMFAASNKSALYLKQYFGNKVKDIFGLTFYYKDGQVDPFETVKHNLLKTREANELNAELFTQHFEPFKPDLVITDFEPFSAWWAWRNSVPYISLDNEHALTHCKLDHVPGNVINRLNAVLVTKGYYMGAFKYIVLNFFKAPLKSSSVVLAPPVIRPEVVSRKASSGDHIVVYTTTAQNEDELVNVLGNFPSQTFHVYGFDRDETRGNCVYRPRSTDGFLDDLASCRAVIASAGFSLLSECMVFGKKMLLIPVPGQYEQIVNAYYVEKLGLGVQSEKIDVEAVSKLLHSIDKPMSGDDVIIWPDNEKFFETLSGVLAQLPKPISI